MCRLRMAKSLVPFTILLGLSACAANPPARDWTLLPATESEVEREILVTIPSNAAIDQTASDLAADYGVELVAEWPISTLDVHCFVFRTSDEQSVDTQIAAMAGDPRLVGVQPMNSFDVLGVSYDDALAPLQHSLVALETSGAHASSTGRSVSVALVDTGVDSSHPDLTHAMVVNRDFVGDGNDGAADVHGTALAGVIGATANNGIGIVGIAPDAEITSLRGCWEKAPTQTGRCTSFTLARALNVAVSQDFDVINLSLQGPFDPLLAEIIKTGIDRGQVFIAAFEPDRGGDFPATLPGVIAAASEPQENAVNAPGLDILTTVPGAGYDYFSGSSFASAHVTGVAALLLEHDPSLSAADIEALLISSIVNVADGVDACLALRELVGEQACESSSKG